MGKGKKCSKEGEGHRKCRFRLGEHQIPSVIEKLVKNLGKVRVQIPSRQPVLTWRRVPERFKPCVYQHVMLPRILRPLLIYEVQLIAE